jgi:inner membrane protein
MEPNGKSGRGAIPRAVRRHALLVKILIIGALLLILLWPLARYNSLVAERQERRNQTESEIIGQWGGEQTVAGPILIVPYIERSVDESGRKVETVSRAFFLPDTLSISGELDPQIRSRGMYDATLYTTRLAVRGSFRGIDFSGWRVAPSDILWEQAEVAIELPDMRALRERTTLRWGNAASDFHPGKGSAGLFPGEIVAAAPGLRSSAGRDTSSIPFSFDLGIQGGGSIAFLPLGDETSVRIRSSWKSPNFSGAFLPATRELSDKGFEAEWKVLSMARAYPQRFRAGEIDAATIHASGFKVDLMTPVDAYLKVTRALKYGILFLVLPFAALFLFEVFSSRGIHPLSYLFIGFADCLFYLLLLSLSEHMSFALAYAIGSVATCALVTVYTCAIAKSWRSGIFMLPVLAASYGFLAVVLHSEDYALLIGSVGLFAILAAVMMMTRRINWYRVGRKPGETEEAADGARG